MIRSAVSRARAAPRGRRAACLCGRPPTRSSLNRPRSHCSPGAPATHREALLLPGLPTPALAAAMIADAADALAVAHQAGRPHLRLTPRSMRWDNASGLKITGLGLDAALCGSTEQ